jgi:hypothetical protein
MLAHQPPASAEQVVDNFELPDGPPQTVQIHIRKLQMFLV